MSKHYFFSLSFLLTLSFLMPFAVKASEFVTADNIHINSDFEGNIYAAGKSIDVDDTLTGDLIAAGMNVLINGTIKGDLTLISFEADLNGVVHGDVRVACGSVDISNTVYGDLIVLAGNVTIATNAVIHGDILIYGGTVEIQGTAKRSVKLKGNDISLAGTYEGPVEVDADDVLLNGRFEQYTQVVAEEIESESELQLLNELNYYSEEGKQDFSPYLSGQGKAFWNPQLAPAQPKQEKEENTFSVWGYYNIVSILGAILVIGILILLSNHTFKKSAYFLRFRFWKSLGLGMLIYLGIPALILLLFVTIIGIPIAFVLITVYILLILLSNTLAAVIIAYLLKEQFGKKWNTWILIAIAGLVFLLLKGLIFIPIIGWLTAALINICSVGAILQSRKKNIENINHTTQIHDKESE